jgi:hypothetical protein
MTKSIFPQKSVFSGLKNDWVKLWIFSNIKKIKVYFPNFSAIKNHKVQISALFPT